MSTPTSDLAAQAAEAVRELNHLTYQPGALPVPGSYTIIAELVDLAYRSGQLLDQLAANLTARHHLGGLRLDAIGREQFTNPEAAVKTGRNALTGAARTARLLARALTDAQDVTATIADTDRTTRRRP